MEFSWEDHTAPKNPYASQTRAQFGQVTATDDAGDTARGATLRSTKWNGVSPNDDALMSIRKPDTADTVLDSGYHCSQGVEEAETKARHFCL